MRLTCKAGFVPAFLVAVALASLPARAQTLDTPGGYSGSELGSVSPAPFGYRAIPSDGLAFLDAARFSWPGTRFVSIPLGMNPLLPPAARGGSAFTAFGLSPLLIPGFTHSAFAWSGPTWNDDLKLWINGLGTFGPDVQRYALYANAIYGGVIFGGPAPGQALQDEPKPGSR